MAITSADEVSKLAPGLTLVNRRFHTLVTLRGVTWQPGSGTPATPIYFNEVPFDPGNTIMSMFDVGQIEVLRGPQGTSRGAPSISGAVTISTRKPDLDEFGGYVQGLYGSGDHWDVQGAVNVPIIKDVLAIRLAANIEDSNGGRIYSVNSSVQPKLRTAAIARRSCSSPPIRSRPGDVSAPQDAEAEFYAGGRHRQPRVCGARHTRQFQWPGAFGAGPRLGSGFAEQYPTHISTCSPSMPPGTC